MKQILSHVTIIVIIFSSISINSQNNEYIFNWDLKSKIITYQIKNYNLSNENIKINDIFTNKKTDLEFPVESSMTILLKQYNDSDITINIYIDNTDNNQSSNKNAKDNLNEKISIKELMEKISGKIAIIGRIENNGNMKSFWLRESQRNLITLLFGLPMRSVKIGDSWDLNLNLLNTDPTFKCIDSRKSTKVNFDSIEYDSNKEIIAIFKYDIIEKIKGESGFGNIDWEMSFKGIGKYNYTKKEWKSLKLINTTLLKGGIMQGNNKQLMELKKIDSIPEKYTVIE